MCNTSVKHGCENMQGLHKGVVNKDLHNVHMVVNKDLHNVHMVASFFWGTRGQQTVLRSEWLLQTETHSAPQWRVLWQCIVWGRAEVFAKCGGWLWNQQQPPIITTPPHCAEEPQTCGTLLIQNAGHTRCKQNPRHGIYSKLVTSIWSQQDGSIFIKPLLVQFCRQREKSRQSRNWMQRSRGDYSNEQTGNGARDSVPNLC